MSDRVTIQLKESVNTIEKRIFSAARDELNAKFPLAVNGVRKIIRTRLFQYITGQPEWNSIQNGKLQAELGLVNGTERLVNILNIWISNIDVSFHKFRVVANGLSGGIKVEAIRSDYSDVISTADAILITEKGEALPWLQWLLIFGDKTIIGDYHVQFGNFGRTDQARMNVSGTWNIPSEFAGVPGNNFVTNALNASIQDIENDIQILLEGLL